MTKQLSQCSESPLQQTQLQQKLAPELLEQHWIWMITIRAIFPYSLSAFAVIHLYIVRIACGLIVVMVVMIIFILHPHHLPILL